jgi:hypothetical protein
LAELDLILATNYQEYNVKTYLATIGASKPIPLPPDFFQLRAVDYGNPGAWQTIYSFQLPERNMYSNPIDIMYQPYTNNGRRIRVMGNQILVEPISLSAGQYQIWYVPKFTFIDDPTQPIPQYMNTQAWLEYAVASTGVKVYSILFPTPGSSDSFEKQRAYYEEMVRNGAQNRMAQGAKGITRTRSKRGWGKNSGAMR